MHAIYGRKPERAIRFALRLERKLLRSIGTMTFDRGRTLPASIGFSRAAEIPMAYNGARGRNLVGAAPLQRSERPREWPEPSAFRGRTLTRGLHALRLTILNGCVSGPEHDD